MFETKKVILFDIDGTLIDVTPLHVKAYEDAFKRIAKVTISNPPHLTREFGKPEAELMESVLRTYGVKQFRPALITGLIKAYTKNVLRFGTVISSRNVLPGVRVLLSALKKRGKVLVAVSGNPKAIGDALLERTGLMSFFDATAYSTEKINRKTIAHRHEILELGLQRVATKKGIKIAPNHVLVIGDAPADVKAAKAIGVDSLAVASGRYTKSELLAFKPTHVLGSLHGIVLPKKKRVRAIAPVRAPRTVKKSHRRR